MSGENIENLKPPVIDRRYRDRRYSRVDSYPPLEAAANRDWRTMVD